MSFYDDGRRLLGSSWIWQIEVGVCIFPSRSDLRARVELRGTYLGEWGGRDRSCAGHIWVRELHLMFTFGSFSGTGE